MSIFSNDINYNFVTNTALSTLSNAIDDQFTLTTTYVDDQITFTTTYIDDKILEQHAYTDQEIEALRVEGYIQEAVTHALAWITSYEGERFRKKCGLK